MIGTHQFRFRPVGAGTSLAPYYIVHIPNEQAVVFGVATNRFCRCNCAGIDGVCPFPPSLPETFVRARRSGQENGDIGKAVTQQFDKLVHLVIMQIDIIPAIVTLVCSKRENQQFGLQGYNIRNTSRMGKRQTSGSVHSHIRIRDSPKRFFQQRSRSLRIDMPPNMAVTNMKNTHRIFGKAGTHLTKPFKYGCQQSNAVDNLIPAGFAESGGKRCLHRDRVICPVHFPQRLYVLQGLPQWRTSRDTVLRHSLRKKRENSGED